MFRRLITLAAFAVATTPALAADQYAVDAAHAGVNFRVSHLALSWTLGRFNDVAGEFTIDPDPAKCSFALTIKVESIDSNNKARDTHLRSPDFFDEKQFPLITFKSTAVKLAAEGYEVTGNLTLHGVTKPITFPLKGGKTAQMPPGQQRTGFSTELSLKRSDFGMSKALEMVGDQVFILVSFEGVKK